MNEVPEIEFATAQLRGDKVRLIMSTKDHVTVEFDLSVPATALLTLTLQPTAQALTAKLKERQA